MADPENVENTEQTTAETQSEKKSGGKLMSLVVPILTALVLAGGGFFVGRMFGTRGQAQNLEASEQPPAKEVSAEQAETDAEMDAEWFFDVDSIVANLNEPGVTRYVRIGLTMGIGSGLSEKEGIPLLEKKMPLLKNWLTLYMANQSVADIQGEAKLLVVQDEIAKLFNKGLFGNGSSHIKQILFKEFSIQ